MDFFLSHSAERFCVGTLLCIRKILVSRKIIHKRGISQFFGEVFRITMPKIFIQESFIVSESFVYRKGLCKKVDITIFSRFFLLSPIAELFHTGTLKCFRKFRLSKKFMHRKRISRNSVDYFLSQNAENLHTGTLQCFRKFGVSKKFMHKREIP